MASALLTLFLFSASTGARAVNQRSTAETYFLPGNKRDSCYDEPYFSDRVDCIERLLSLYYVDHFIANCPNSVHWFARNKCKGCPWDRIDVNAITPAVARNLSYSKLFHPAAPSCSLEHHLGNLPKGNIYLYLSFFGFAIPLFCGIFLAKQDAQGLPTTPVVFGTRMPESFYFGFLWLLFHVGYGLSIAGHEIYETCHDPFSSFSLLIGDWINLAIMMWTSLWRCRYLQAPGRPNEVSSWASYRGSALYRASSLWHKRLVDLVCGVGPVLILLSPVPDKDFEKESLVSPCQYGSYKSISFGLIQYLKIVLGIVAVGVYSLGPPRSPVFFYVRYFSLIVIMLVSVSFLYIMRLPVYESQCISMLLPRVLDCNIAGPVHAVLVAHAFATALFGVAEPLRLGWPKRRNVE